MHECLQFVGTILCTLHFVILKLGCTLSIAESLVQVQILRPQLLKQSLYFNRIPCDWTHPTIAEV